MKRISFEREISHSNIVRCHISNAIPVYIPRLVLHQHAAFGATLCHVSSQMSRALDAMCHVPKNSLIAKKMISFERNTRHKQKQLRWKLNLQVADCNVLFERDWKRSINIGPQNVKFQISTSFNLSSSTQREILQKFQKVLEVREK